MISLTQFINEELSTSMETRIVDWYREKHPGIDDAILSEFSVSATFQGVYDRLNGKTPLGEGDDAIYGYVNVYRTDVAVEILSQLSSMTEIPEENLRDLWMTRVGLASEAPQEA